jgi:Lar family restriction alleviation protein
MGDDLGGEIERVKTKIKTSNSKRSPVQCCVIKPCPFCGGNDIIVDAAGIYNDDDSYTEWMICVNCDASGPASKDSKASWNTRAL